MTASETQANPLTATAWPAVTIVFLVYNRCRELRISLKQMLGASDYPPGQVDVIVVDNASTDATVSMVQEEFPQVQLIRRAQNIGVSGWNEGLAAARGDWVLALDDDCYLPPDGLRRAVAAATAQNADLVSFRVISTFDPGRVFTEDYRTGLFMFWGCAVLMRRQVVEALGGYDPEIFVWANELEFMLRFFDHGFRHLHLPEVVAQHMKAVPETAASWIEERPYRINARHWAYIAAKLFPPHDAVEALAALLAQALRDGLRTDRVALRGLGESARGFAHGLRHRQPLRNRQLSRFYRRNFQSFAGPWAFARTPGELLRSLPQELRRHPLRPGTNDVHPGRREAYFSARASFYPDRAATLTFSPAPSVAAVGDSSDTRLNG